MSRATSKNDAIQNFRTLLADASKEIDNLKSDAVWGKMCGKLTAGYASRHMDADANMFLYRVVYRNVYQDTFPGFEGFSNMIEFYRFLSGDPDATEKSLRNHFGNRRTLGAEMWGAIETGKAPKAPKPVVETIAVYLATVPGKLAKATATPEQITAIRDHVNKASDAVAALMARMDAAKAASDATDKQNAGEPTLTPAEVDALVAAHEKIAA